MAASPVIRADPSREYMGCSSISQYEVLQKLGEGTFGYEANEGWTSQDCQLTGRNTVKFIWQSQEEMAQLLH
jgi:hypothetical protein